MAESGARGGGAVIPGPDPRFLSEIVLLAAIVGVFTFAMFPLLGRPFSVGHDGFNGAVFSMSAINTLRFGLAATGGGPTREYWDEERPAKKDFYTSKPYGHPLLLAATYAVFGVSERAGRSLSFAFCLGLLMLLYFVGRGVGASLGGLVAAGTAASLPMIHDFGPMMIGQIPSLVFVLALYFFYFRCLRAGHGSAGVTAGIFMSLLGAGLLDWHVFSHLPVLALHFAWVRRREPGRVLRFWFLLGLAAAVPLLLFAVQTYWLDGFPYLLAKLTQRTGFAPAVAFTWPEFFSRQWKYLRMMYRAPTVLVALVALLMPAAGPARDLQRLGRLSAVTALVETLFLNEAIFIHIYYTFVWVIPICFALASLAELLASAVGELMPGTIAAVLLSVLFTSAFHQAQTGANASLERSLPLIRVAQDLSHRLEPGQKVVFYMEPNQLGPQIRYYLRREFIYPQSVWEADTQARRCPECRFLVMKAEGSKMPNAGALREALLRLYPHELAHGFYIFTLPREPRPARG